MITLKPGLKVGCFTSFWGNRGREPDEFTHTDNHICNNHDRCNDCALMLHDENFGVISRVLRIEL